ncbi:Zinc finger MYND-type [Penicillium hetheringtonii]|uniref:Zinc finger MYND-type n=1 Tax=Penicillium hetheringtonii TaxID=911720 RepID=A0AAD6DRT4_9EURO|nr:Zinc finger MYND-type [Penicillium hetheringtonii]
MFASNTADVPSFKPEITLKSLENPVHHEPPTGCKLNDVDKGKQALIDHPDFKNDNPFENHVGRFWKIVETRHYMNALSKLATITSGERHIDSLQAEYDNRKELLRLGPGDNMGARATIPRILLRLGKEQECYDFTK